MCICIRHVTAAYGGLVVCPSLHDKAPCHCCSPSSQRAPPSAVPTTCSQKASSRLWVFFTVAFVLQPAEFQASGEALRGSAARPFATVASAGLSQKVQQETQKQYLEQLFLQHQRGATSGAEDFSAWRSPAWSVVNNFPNSPYMMSPYMTPAHPASPPPPSPQSGSLYHDYAPLPLTRATVGEGGWPLYRRVTTHSSSTGSQASCRVPAAGSVAEQKKGGKAISSSASRLSMSQERTPASSRGEGRLHSLSRAGDSSTPSGRRSKSSSARPQPPPIRGVGGGPVYKVLWYDRRADVSEFRSREDAFTK